MRDLLTNESLQKKDGSPIVIDFNNFKDIKYGYSMYKNRFSSCIVNGHHFQIKDRSIIKNMDLLYNEDIDLYYENKYFSKYGDREVSRENFSRFGTTPLINSSMSNLEKIKFGIKSPTFIISENKQYTFGVEIETSSGLVAESLTTQLNVKGVRDGSLYDDDGRKAVGGEYVTGVLTGDMGFLQLKRILNMLIGRTRVNKTCSIHVHIGNVFFNKEMVVMLWKMGQVLETELFSMMPPSRIHRDHCSPMTQKFPIKFSNKIGYDVQIDKYYAKIIRILSLGKKNDKHLNKKYNHPNGHYCGYNLRTPRYWWLNFIPTVFNLKGIGNYTIEFRMHSGTLDYTKIKNWVLICMAFVSVAENNKRFLIENNTFTIKDILNLSFPKKREYLNEYVENRKKLFSNENTANMFEKCEYTMSAKRENISIKNLIWDL